MTPSDIQVVGIAGGSGSGKTTFSRALKDALGDSTCSILAQDSYYIDQSARFTGDGESVNFDHPDSIDFALMAEHLRHLRQGTAVEVPIYDFATHKRLKESRRMEPKPVILVDGILILSQPGIRSCLDYSVFIETREEIRFDRRLARDHRERGRLPEGIRKQFLLQVKPMHDLHVEPSQGHASQVISGEKPFRAAIESLAQDLRHGTKAPARRGPAR